MKGPLIFQGNLSQIDEREEEYPDEIDEMPIYTAHFNAVDIFSLFDIKDNNNHSGDTDDHMECMHTGEEVIEPPEGLSGSESPLGVNFSKDNSVSNFRDPLDGFNPEEEDTEANGDPEGAFHFFNIFLCGIVVSHNDKEAAGEEDDGIQGAEGCTGEAGEGIVDIGVSESVEEVDDDGGAEYGDFTGDEEPDKESTFGDLIGVNGVMDSGRHGKVILYYLEI